MLRNKDYVKRIFFTILFAIGIVFIAVPGNIGIAEAAEVKCNESSECVKSETGWENARCAGGVKGADTLVGRCVEVPQESQQLPDGPESFGGILGILDTITDWIFAIIMTVALIFLIMAAFQFVTGGGDPAKVSEARQKLMYAFIGIAIAFVSAGFIRVISVLVQ